MINIPFLTKTNKKYLGIDIGTSFVRMVELSRKGGNVVLENYAEMSVRHLSETALTDKKEKVLSFSSTEIASVISSILKEAEIKTKRAYFAIPDFVSFFTSFAIPSMKEDEIDEAVQFHSRQHIPISLSEVVLDWSVLEQDPRKEEKDIEIALMVVSKDVVDQLGDIAKMCSLDLIALEGESFGLSRALTKKDSGVVAIVDMGSKSSTITVTDNGTLKTTHSLDIAENTIIKQVASSMHMDYTVAVRELAKYGFKKSNIEKSVDFIMESFFSEIKNIFRGFQQEREKKIEKIIFVGGVSTLPGFMEYVSNFMEVTIEQANCFKDISYPPELKNTIKEIGPLYAVATGMALRGIEEGEKK